MKKVVNSTRFLIVMVSLFVLLASLICIFRLRFNVTNSLPKGIYRVIQKPIARGDLVEVCLPASLEKFGLSRSYLLGGNCQEGAAPVFKQIIAIAGDCVDLEKNSIRVNDSLISQSATLTYDEEHRTIPSLPRTHFFIPANNVFLYGNHDPRSWDSRYYGPIHVSNIRSIIIPLLTF